MKNYNFYEFWYSIVHRIIFVSRKTCFENKSPFENFRYSMIVFYDHDGTLAANVLSPFLKDHFQLQDTYLQIHPDQWSMCGCWSFWNPSFLWQSEACNRPACLHPEAGKRFSLKMESLSGTHFVWLSISPAKSKYNNNFRKEWHNEIRSEGTRLPVSPIE